MIPLALTLMWGLPIKAQNAFFEQSYKTLTNMLKNPHTYNFKDAVLSVENAYYDGGLNVNDVDNQIQILKELSQNVKKSRTLKYNERDKKRINTYASVFTIFKDSIAVYLNHEKLMYYPFTYNFDDPFGRKNWDNMFVSKLLTKKSGNCHSLPYLYKILVEEMGETAHLALAPNHIYIKQRSKKDGWYNTELTSGIFPIDAWLMASGYIHLDAIKNSVYMKALNNQESIALCLVDLAQAYNKRFPYNDGKFVLRCCNTALKYFPKFINAMLVKSEAKRKQIEQFLSNKRASFPEDIFKYEESTFLFKDMQKQIKEIHSLGYRKMPEQMYLDWLVSLKKEKTKYSNTKINTLD
ncbi:hypothetical protein [Tenacibaculum agarivorans]|uniref:hypothetical protein n=1 Tax=Tenacibaculum agarivorans TaxID=1908389 RepID=UPI00094BA8EE|nr:hypothetical protein [Tenacibaculum agarivorans]